MSMIAVREFESLWGQGASQADPERVAADLEKLQAAVDPVKEFADKHVAHLDHTPVDEVPSFEELDQAINTLGDLFKRYYRAVTGVSGSITLTIIDNWMAPFRVAWLPGDPPSAGAHPL